MAKKKSNIKFPIRIEYLCDNALEVVDKSGYSLFEVSVEDYSIPRETIDAIREIVDICNEAKKKKA